MEETLWESANKLRGSVESSEYKHIVLGLIFLKFVSDTFEERRKKLLAEGKEAFIDMVEFYTMENVFYLPVQSRWSYIKQNAKQDDIALKIDTALSTIEKNNPSLFVRGRRRAARPVWRPGPHARYRVRRPGRWGGPALRPGRAGRADRVRNTRFTGCYHPRPQVPNAMTQRENREGGATPPRAQRCKDDAAHKCHWLPWCSVSRYLTHKKASFRPWLRCKSSRYRLVSLWFAPCQAQKSILFIRVIQRKTLHWPGRCVKADDSKPEDRPEPFLALQGRAALPLFTHRGLP